MFKLLRLGFLIFLSIKLCSSNAYSRMNYMRSITVPPTEKVILHGHPHGHSENILKFSNNKTIIIDEVTIEKLFDHPDVKDRKIVAFSIIGAFRKGKSFFLDYCLRYLYAHYKSINYPENPLSSPDNWMGAKNEPLKGFSWRGGRNRDTTGIIMWNDVFLHEDVRTGQKIAIIVIDTQGLFDTETTPLDNSRIFALGTLISSIQVLNLFSLVQEDQLQYLQFATEFAKFASDDSHGTSGKPFQNLMFLVRDWTNTEDHEYGIEGGEEYINYFLEINKNQNEELKTVRQFIRSSFDELSCALLPAPGKIVTGGGRNQTKKYNGNWGDMDVEFKEELETLINHLLSPDHLVVKKINGNDLSGREYREYLVQYFKLFQSDTLPKAQSIYESTIEKQMMILVNECVMNYRDSIYMNEGKITNVDQIPAFHKLSRLEALEIFTKTKKMGNKNHEEKYREILEVEFEKIYQRWSDQSERKIKKLETEREKAKLAEEEKQRLFLEQKEKEKNELKHLAELEKLKAQQAIDEVEYEKQKQLAEERVKSEQEKTKLLEEQHQKQEQQRLKLDAHIKALEEAKRQEMEKVRKVEEEKVALILKQKQMELDAQIKIAELEKLNAQKMIDETKFAMEKALAEERLKNEQERTEKMKKEFEKEENLRKKLDEENKKIEEEREQAVDYTSPVSSLRDEFYLQGVFFGRNTMRLKLTLTSAKGLANAHSKLKSDEFRSYYYHFIYSIRKVNGSYKGGRYIDVSDLENVFEKIQSGIQDFKEKVDELERNTLDMFLYVYGKRENSYAELVNDKFDVFVIARG